MKLLDELAAEFAARRSQAPQGHRSVRYTNTQKRKAVEVFQSIGLKRRRFCKELGIAESTLSQWVDSMKIKNAFVPVRIADSDFIANETGAGAAPAETYAEEISVSITAKISHKFLNDVLNLLRGGKQC